MSRRPCSARAAIQEEPACTAAMIAVGAAVAHAAAASEIPALHQRSCCLPGTADGGTEPSCIAGTDSQAMAAPTLQPTAAARPAPTGLEQQTAWLKRELVDEGEQPWSNRPALTRLKSSSFPHAASKAYQVAQSIVSQDLRGTPYSSASTLHRVAVKIPGRNPNDVPPSWQQPFISLCSSLGMQLRGAYVRSGCVHLLLELWNMEGLSDRDAMAFLASLRPEQWMELLGQDSLVANREIQVQLALAPLPQAADAQSEVPAAAAAAAGAGEVAAGAGGAGDMAAGAAAAGGLEVQARAGMPSQGPAGMPQSPAAAHDRHTPNSASAQTAALPTLAATAAANQVEAAGRHSPRSSRTTPLQHQGAVAGAPFVYAQGQGHPPAGVSAETWSQPLQSESRADFLDSYFGQGREEQDAPWSLSQPVNMLNSRQSRATPMRLMGETVCVGTPSNPPSRVSSWLPPSWLPPGVGSAAPAGATGRSSPSGKPEDGWQFTAPPTRRAPARHTSAILGQAPPRPPEHPRLRQASWVGTVPQGFIPNEAQARGELDPLPAQAEGGPLAYGTASAGSSGANLRLSSRQLAAPHRGPGRSPSRLLSSSSSEFGLVAEMPPGEPSSPSQLASQAAAAAGVRPQPAASDAPVLPSAFGAPGRRTVARQTSRLGMSPSPFHGEADIPAAAQPSEAAAQPAGIPPCSSISTPPSGLLTAPSSSATLAPATSSSVSHNVLSATTATSTTWILSFGADPSVPPTVTPHPNASSPPDLVCVSPGCLLLPQAQQPAGDSGPLVLHAAGKNLQSSSPEAGPTRCWVRYRGQYLESKASLYGDMLPTQHLSGLLPPSAVAQCDVMRVELSPRHEGCWMPGLMQIECQHSNHVLGAPKPVLLVSDAGVHAEITRLWNQKLLAPGADVSQMDGLMVDMGMWLEAVEMVGKVRAQALSPSSTGLGGSGAQHGAEGAPAARTGPGAGYESGQGEGGRSSAGSGSAGATGAAGNALRGSVSGSSRGSGSCSSSGTAPSDALQQEVLRMLSPEQQAVHSWAVRCGTKLLLYAISQDWPCTVSMLASGMLSMLGCTLKQLNAQATAQEGLDLMHLAVRAHSVALVRLLVQLGARYNFSWDPASRGIAGLTPLHLAAVLPDRGLVACQLLQLLPGAPRAWFTAASRDGTTPQSMSLTAGNMLPCRLADVLLRRLSDGSAGTRAEVAGESEQAQQATLRHRLSRSMTDPRQLDQGSAEHGDATEAAGGAPAEGAAVPTSSLLAPWVPGPGGATVLQQGSNDQRAATEAGGVAGSRASSIRSSRDEGRSPTDLVDYGLLLGSSANMEGALEMFSSLAYGHGVQGRGSEDGTVASSVASEGPAGRSPMSPSALARGMGRQSQLWTDGIAAAPSAQPEAQDAGQQGQPAGVAIVKAGTDDAGRASKSSGRLPLAVVGEWRRALGWVQSLGGNVVEVTRGGQLCWVLPDVLASICTQGQPGPSASEGHAAPGPASSGEGSHAHLRLGQQLAALVQAVLVQPVCFSNDRLERSYAGAREKALGRLQPMVCGLCVACLVIGALPLFFQGRIAEAAEALFPAIVLWLPLMLLAKYARRWSHQHKQSVLAVADTVRLLWMLLLLRGATHIEGWVLGAYAASNAAVTAVNSRLQVPLSMYAGCLQLLSLVHQSQLYVLAGIGAGDKRAMSVGALFVSLGVGLAAPTVIEVCCLARFAASSRKDA